MKVKIIRFDENARIPEKAHPSDFGFDVWAVSEEEIVPNVWRYGLGFGLQIERTQIGYGDQIELFNEAKEGPKFVIPKFDTIDLSVDFRPRSSIFKTGMVLANSVPTIDENYTGEIKLIFYHVMPDMPRYKVGDKIAQCKLGMAFPMEFCEVDQLDERDRGEDNFGSTGKR